MGIIAIAPPPPGTDISVFQELLTTLGIGILRFNFKNFLFHLNIYKERNLYLHIDRLLKEFHFKMCPQLLLCCCKGTSRLKQLLQKEAFAGGLVYSSRAVGV